MQGYHALLGIHSCAAFKRRAYKHTHISLVHSVKQFLLVLRLVKVVNKGYLAFGNALVHKLFLDVIIYAEFSFRLEKLLRGMLYLRPFFGGYFGQLSVTHFKGSVMRYLGSVIHPAQHYNISFGNTAEGIILWRLAAQFIYYFFSRVLFGQLTGIYALVTAPFSRTVKGIRILIECRLRSCKVAENKLRASLVSRSLPYVKDIVNADVHL